MIKDLLDRLDTSLAAKPAALALLCCLMPVYGYVLLMVLADPPSWVTGAIYLALASLAVLPLASRWRVLLAPQVRLANVAFVALLAVIVISWSLRSRGDPMADKAILLAPMAMVAPWIGGQLLAAGRERRGLFVWIATIGVLAMIVLLYWVAFGLLSDKPRLQFGLGVRVYLADNQWTGQRIYVDPIGSAWLAGMVACVCAVWADRMVIAGRVDRAARLVLLVLVAVAAWLMLRSTGRSPLLAWGLAAAGYLVVLCERRWRQRLVIAVVSVIACAGFALTLPAGTRAYYLGTTQTYTWERPLDLTHNQPGMDAADYSARNVLRRQLVWRDHGQVFLDHPVFGVGHGGAHRHASTAVDRLSHNLFVEMASGNGLIGLAALFAWLLAVARVGWRLWRDPSLEGEARTVTAVAALFVAASLVQLNFSATLTGFVPLFAAGGVLLGVAARREPGAALRRGGS